MTFLFFLFKQLGYVKIKRALIVGGGFLSGNHKVRDNDMLSGNKTYKRCDGKFYFVEFRTLHLKGEVTVQ